MSTKGYWATSKNRYRASAREERAYGGKTITEFFVGEKGDENSPHLWVTVIGYGKTPGERKTFAINAAKEKLALLKNHAKL